MPNNYMPNIPNSEGIKAANASLVNFPRKTVVTKVILHFYLYG